MVNTYSLKIPQSSNWIILATAAPVTAEYGDLVAFQTKRFGIEIYHGRAAICF